MFGLTNPFAVKIAEYLIVISVVFGAFYYVYERGFDTCDQQWIVKQAKSDKAQQDKYDKVAADYETLKNTRQQNVNTITHEITHIIDKPIYATACIDDSGRMLINDAIAGRKYSGSADTAVPTIAKP